MHESGIFNQNEISKVLSEITETTGGQQLSIGVKAVLTAITTASHSEDKVGRFAQIIAEGVSRNMA